MTKTCFVTIGATAQFQALIQGVLDVRFIQKLRGLGYTELLLQYGSNGKRILDEFQATHAGTDGRVEGLAVSGFDYKHDGLRNEMILARGGSDGSEEGVVISHAGSGTILAAFRINVPLILVPNTTLLGNHQVELAEELAEQGYIIQGHIEDLPAALAEVEHIRANRISWPPIKRNLDRSGRGLAGVMDEEMGFVD